MEEEEIGLVLAALLFSKKEKVERRRQLKYLRDASDPFRMEESIFMKNFRFPRAVCRQLIAELQPHDKQKSSMPFELRFLSALTFFAHGSYQRCVGNRHHIAMSQATVSRSLTYISELIVQVKGSVVRFPQSYEEETAIKMGFFRKFGIKGTIGAVDCMHIAIQSPQRNDDSNPLSLYMNRKGYNSVNVEAICDHRLIFTSINPKFPGSCDDSDIWTTCPARQILSRKHIPQRDTWLLGDQGYPLEPWLLTPVEEPFSENELNYNKLHARARNTIERAFRLLKTRFKCLSRHRVLHYSHKKAACIINVCVILHNILLMNGVTLETSESLTKDYLAQSDAVQFASRENSHSEGERMRSSYIQTL